MKNEQTLIAQLYERFNARDIDGVLQHLAPDVAWANGMEGTHVHGLAAVREYWSYQWTVINPRVEPIGMRTNENGATVVSVHQIVHDLAGKLLLDETIEHVFTVMNARVTRFDIQGNSQLPSVPH